MAGVIHAAVIVLATCLAHAAPISAVVDNTNYNVGSVVNVRLAPATKAGASIRYAGEDRPIVTGLKISGGDYSPLWTIPWDARTGRYEVDLSTGSGVIRDAGSFAVHRQLAKVITADLDKTFYTAGDPVNPRIVVRNLSNRALTNLRVEFEAYTYPWIAPQPDEPPAWKTIVADKLTLGPGEQRDFHAQKAAVVQADKEPVDIYFSAVIRDSTDQDRIYDLAFFLPAFTVPVGEPLPKQYPFLYLYNHLRDVPKSESYRHFYPPQFVSDEIKFDTAHTMFPTGVQPAFSYTANGPATVRVLNAEGHEIPDAVVRLEAMGIPRRVTVRALDPGLYTLEVTASNGVRNRLEFGVNKLPKSILVFCAHEDDDTAHPAIIRAAAENNIPIHFVYFTSGDAGGCDRYYMHSCDAARAMDFGEVRMQEARASLGHLGIPGENIFFLGMPDGGLEQIWYKHVGSDNPYLSVLLASDHAPYRDAAVANLPYSRDAAVGAAKQFIQRFNPEMIITGHPDERHVDHRTNNWIVVKAMQELLREGKLSRDTQLIVDVAYGAKAGRHAPYKYEKYMLHVSGEAAKLGQEALWYYQSQDGNHQQAEIIDYDKLPRTEPWPHFRILDWQEHEGWNEHP